MTGKWDDPAVPHGGWVCVDVEDLGDPSAICEMCEVQIIRFVHEMEHPDWRGTLRCGCICSAAMECDEDGAHRREAGMRNTAKRKDNWLTRDWRVSHQGNWYINANGYNVVVFQKGIAWSFRIMNRKTDDRLFAKIPLASPDAAKLRAFDAIQWMKERGR
jgi:hypothetical protein